MFTIVFPFAFLIYVGNSFVAASWRYYPVTGNEFGYFTTRTKFILEYTGNEDWLVSMSWYHHDYCTVDNKSLPLTIAQCSTAGFHQFGIINQSDTPTEVQSILVVKSPYCYQWQLKPLPANSSSLECNQRFQVWIDKINEVKSNNISTPSEFSRQITSTFYQFGVKPSLSAFTSHSNNEEEIVRQEIYFSENASVWEVKVMIAHLELLKIKIDGPPVTFLDCFIKPIIFEIQHKKFNNLSPLTEFSFKEGVSQLTFVQDHCSPNIIAAFINDHLIITQDYFLTVSSLTEYLLKNNISSINKVVFTNAGSLLFHNGNQTFLMVTNSSDLHAIQGLPRGKLHFTSYLWCDQDKLRRHKTFSDVILAWTNESLVYISLNLTTGFTPLSFPDYVQDKNFRLLGAKVNGICLCVYFLIELSNNHSKVISYTTYDYGEKAWGDVTILLNDSQYFINDSSWSFQFLPPNTFSFLLWNSRNVFYKPPEGVSIMVITKQGNISNTNRIIDVTTSNNGDYVVLFESNVLYYGRIGVDFMVQVHSRLSVEAAIRMMFDLNGYLYAVSVNKSISSITTTNYPLDNEIFNALYPSIICPFLEFSFGSLSLSNIVDKWGQFQIWGYLVYKRTKPNDIQLVWNPTSLLQVSVSEQKEYYQDVIMLNKTFTFSERSSKKGSFENSTSSFSATLIPKVNGMTCKRPFHKVFHFYTGCPFLRRALIRDARYTQNFSSHEQSTFPVNLLPNEAFQFVLLLYDENILINQANSPFEVTELNGRTDYTMVENQNDVDPAVISFGGSGSFQFLLTFFDKNTSFCRTTVEFSLSVEDLIEPDYRYIEFACVAVVTILFINLLVMDYLRFRKSFLRRHEEDDNSRKRLQELQYLAQLQYFRDDSTAVEVIQPTTEQDEEVKRRAVVIAKTERRGHRRSSVFERVSKGVFEDLKTQRRGLSTSSSVHTLKKDEEDDTSPPNEGHGD